MRGSCGVLVAIVVVWLSAVTTVRAGSKVRPQWVKQREECAAGATDGWHVQSWRKMKSIQRHDFVKDIDNFQGIFVDDERNSVVIGAKDVILHLDVARLSIKQVVNTSAGEAEKKQCLSWAGSNREFCHNFNMLLLPTIKNGDHVYLECGTGAFHPSCIWRFTDSGMENSNSLKARKMCPMMPADDGITASYLDGAVYSASSATFTVVPLGRFFRQPLLEARRDASWLNNPKFIDSFTQGDYIFFFLREVAKDARPLNAVYSRIVRLCKKDNGQRYFHSFMKLRIACTLGKEDHEEFNFNWITSMFRHSGSYNSEEQEDLIYATFHLAPNGPGGSAICVYKVKDIMDAFDRTPFIFSREGSWKTQTRLQNSSCRKSKKNTPEENSRLILLRGKKDGLPVVLLEGIRVTNILVDRVQNFDVMFLGTDEGELLKVTRRPNGGLKPLVINRYKVSNSPFRKMVHVRNLGYLIVTTKTDIYHVNYLHCMHSAQSCGACVAARDPYCGWCAKTIRPGRIPQCLPQSLCASTNGTYFQDVNGGNVRICGKEVEIEQPDPRHPTIISVGHKVVLSIKVKNADSLHWERGEVKDRYRVPINFGDRIQKDYDEKQNVARLIIKEVYIKDMDFYHLTASNNISSKNATMKLLVRGTPRIVHQPNNQNVHLNGSAVFGCGLQMRGRSFSLIVLWQFKAKGSNTWKDISTNTGQNKVLQTVDHSLIILRVQRKHQGLYQCLVRSDDSRVTSRSAQLSIVDEPTPGNVQVTNISGKRSENLKIPCGMTGYITDYSWWKDGEMLDIARKSGQGVLPRQPCQHTRTILDDGSLSISCAQPSDCGTYQCEARNSHYTSKGKPVKVCVQDPRQSIVLVSRGQHVAGGNVVLHCTVTGVIVETLKWTGPDGLPIQYDSRHIFSEPKYNSPEATRQYSQHLTIVNTQDSDAGTYGCQAIQSGSVINQTEYAVHFMPSYPHFSESPAHILIPASESTESLLVQFHCHTHCTSTQSYSFTWRHNGQVIMANNYSNILSNRCHSQLSLTTTNDVREGTYECRATLESHNGNTCAQLPASTFGYLTTTHLESKMNISFEVRILPGRRATIACPGIIQHEEGRRHMHALIPWKALGEDGTEMNIGTDVSQPMHVTGHGELRFKSLRPRMAGFYRCSVRDKSFIIRVKLKEPTL